MLVVERKSEKKDKKAEVLNLSAIGGGWKSLDAEVNLSASAAFCLENSIFCALSAGEAFRSLSRRDFFAVLFIF